jgi:Zn-dependent M16 (insulinase) family peptidase
MQIGTTYHGFELLESKHVKEVNSTAHMFRHQKSGARLLYLENDDDNKVFSITFRTPPPDNTGVPHILEHSVLCGSRKFPLKEPFVELIKGSLNTYLNAMTFSDKTMYPVASQNEKDFQNLMDVYLDAVFFPNIYKYPEILMQEGWHYELDDPAGELTYKGVVYNEMKGVFSSPEAVLERKVQEILFPATIYGLESGGDPDHIPTLTQEDFAAFHRKYYHPANSYIYLYGDLRIEQHLKFIDEEYLHHFDVMQVESSIDLQDSFEAPKTVTVEYPISSTEREEHKTFLSLNFVVGRGTDVETCLAFGILKHMLLGTPAAPLKKALIDAGIGKDVYGSYNDGILQPTFNVVARNANVEHADKFREIVCDTLRRLAKEGIDKRLVEASINIREFQLREANYGTRPKGLGYNIKCLDSWLYDAPPTLHLEYDAVLERIKSALTQPYFEQMIEKYLLQNDHSALFIVKPKRGLAEARAEEIRKELTAYKARLGDAEIKAIVEQTQKLKERQTTPDDPEALTSIPLLSLEDIDPQVPKLPLSEGQEQDIKVLTHPLFTNHIAYVNCYFDTSGVPQDLLPYVYLLTGILGKIGTEKYDYAELSNMINIHTGGISSGALAYPEKGNDAVYNPKLVVKTKALVTKLPELMELIGEITGRSKFNDTKRMQELVYEIKARSESIISEMGQSVATSRVLSFCSPVAQYNEIGVLSFYQFLSALTDNLTDRMDDLVRSLTKTADMIFNKQGLLVSVTVSEEEYGKFRESFPILVKYLGDKPLEPVQYQFPLQTRREGLMTSSKVQYVVQGYNFKRLGHQYTGNMKVLETILRYDYLWNRVRVQGGAYGGFAQFDRTGNMICGSYRDPNLRETLDIYDETVDYLKSFQVNDREMTKYIIGTISQLDTPLTPSMKGERAASQYIQKLTWENFQRERQEVLATRQEDIRALAGVVADVMQQDCICVLGGEEKINSCQDCFDTTIHVFE